MEQLTIFDILKPKKKQWPECLDDITEPEMVSMVSVATGLMFVFRDDFWKYEAKVGRSVFRIHFSNYTKLDDNSRFISVEWDYKNGGFGGPCDSIEEAVNTIKKLIERSKKEIA